MLGVGSRTGLQPNGLPAGPQLNVEYRNPLAPVRSWSPSWQISADVAAVGVPGLPYPGRSNAGSDGGILQAAGGSLLGIEYGLREQYVLQADVVQTSGQVVLATGPARGVVYGADTLSVLFFADDGNPTTPGIQLTSTLGVAATVWNSRDGDRSGTADLPIKTGTKAGQWNNYAAAFDRMANRLSLYVNGKLLKTLDLAVFAGGAYRTFSNAAVSLGALGGQRVWMDNFQVGAPYVGYQTAGPAANRTGYDFGAKDATVDTGAIQGAVVLYNRNQTDPFAPTNRPLAGVTVFLDLNGDSTPSAGEPQTTTGVHGGYRFTGLKPGSYVVRQVLPSNYTVVAVQTLGGAPDFHSITISVDVLAGQTAYANNFSDVNRTQGAAGYVRALYRAVLGREADARGLSDWVRFLEGGGSRAQVAQTFWESAEHRGLQVDQLYATHFNRTADAGGRAHWIGALLAGQSEHGVARALLASEEYRRDHANDTAFLTGLYADVLGRAPDAAGLAHWRMGARFGIDRATLADAFLSSEEAHLRRVNRFYADYLGRPADPAGAQGWLEALQGRRATPAQVAQALLASDEFLTRAAVT